MMSRSSSVMGGPSFHKGCSEMLCSMSLGYQKKMDALSPSTSTSTSIASAASQCLFKFSFFFFLFFCFCFFDIC
jgi:hypothetical protein